MDGCEGFIYGYSKYKEMFYVSKMHLHSTAANLLYHLASLDNAFTCMLEHRCGNRCKTGVSCVGSYTPGWDWALWPLCHSLKLNDFSSCVSSKQFLTQQRIIWTLCLVPSVFKCGKWVTDLETFRCHDWLELVGPER